MPQMTKEDASRIQSTQAKSGNNMSSDSFPARAQSAGDRNTNAAAASNENKGGNANSGAGTGAGAGNKK